MRVFEVRNFTKLMWKQFIAQQDDFFRLRKEVDITKAEIAKISERMDLLRRLLALEGKEVKIPPEVGKVVGSVRRKVA
jgi:hypothetical protein